VFFYFIKVPKQNQPSLSYAPTVVLLLRCLANTTTASMAIASVSLTANGCTCRPNLITTSMELQTHKVKQQIEAQANPYPQVAWLHH